MQLNYKILLMMLLVHAPLQLKFSMSSPTVYDILLNLKIDSSIRIMQRSSLPNANGDRKGRATLIDNTSLNKLGSLVKTGLRRIRSSQFLLFLNGHHLHEFGAWDSPILTPRLLKVSVRIFLHHILGDSIYR